MKYLGFIINYYRQDRYARPIVQSQTALTSLFEKLSIAFQQEVETLPAEGLLPYLYEQTKNYDDEDAIVIAFIDSEFYSLEDNKKLLENFERYGCDIGFGDNFPRGVIFEVVKRYAFPVLENLRQSKNITHTRNLIHELIHLDVNMFDLENLYAKINLRTFRLSFFQDNQQDAHTIAEIKKFFPFKEYNQSKNFNDLAESIIKHRHLLRTITKYYEIEISNQCEQECIFCPKTHLADVTPNLMSLQNYKIILKKICDFTHQPIVAFTGLGEAAFNSDFVNMLKYTLENQVECYWETSAALLDQKLADEILVLPNQSLLKVILSLDALSLNLYQKIRPFNSSLTSNKANLSYQTVMDNVEYFLIRKKKKTYVQIIKTQDNFEELAQFHNHFTKNYQANVIIQKYNSYKGLLKERRLNPMQPFERIDCWHLKRDMVIDVEGNVRVCKQDVTGKHLLGNLLSDKIEDVFRKGQDYFEKHIDNWNFCENCDEHYTYNA